MATLQHGMRHVAALHLEDHRPRHDLFQSYHAPDQSKRIVQKIRNRDMLDPIESAYILQEGNRKHVVRLSEFQGEHPEKIKTLMLVCADARMGGMFEFDDFARKGVEVVYVAGNISDILDKPGVKEVFKRMEKHSSVVIMGMPNAAQSIARSIWTCILTSRTSLSSWIRQAYRRVGQCAGPAGGAARQRGLQEARRQEEHPRRHGLR